MTTKKIDHNSLKDQVFIVTGGSRGIGKAIVEELVKSGACVAFTYSKHKSEAEEVVARIKSDGHKKIIALQADARDFKRSQQLVTETIEKFGHLDGLVNNAGIVKDGALMLMQPIDWEEVLSTNLTGVFNNCRAAIVTLMKQRSGRIVNLTSVAALCGGARQVNYAAS